MAKRKHETEHINVPSLFDDEQESSIVSTVVDNSDSKKKTSKKRKVNKKLPPLPKIEVNINQGLNDTQIQERIDRGLDNIVTNKTNKTILGIVLSNLFNIFNLICIFLVVLLIIIKTELGKFLFVLPFTGNIIIGIFQEVRSKLTIDKLSFSIMPKVKVIRNGVTIEINSEDLVIDDIVLIQNGQQVPGDGIVRQGKMEVNESMITGESEPVNKHTNSEVFGGSYVVSGQAVVQLTAVGDESFIQKLAKKAKSYQKPQSEILKSLTRFVWVVFILIIPITFLLLYTSTEGFADGFNIKENATSIETTAAAILGMVPSGLLLLTSVALASSVYKLSKSKVLVQELYCIEMLARVDVLCLDKTGTITDGTMKVVDVIDLGDNPRETKTIISSMLNATQDNNMTSQALIDKFGISKKSKYLTVLPFSSARKYSAVTFKEGVTYVLGAPEFIDRNIYKEHQSTINKETKKGNRVLLLARSDKEITDNKVVGNITAVSLIIIQDNIRENAPDTLKYFKDNGVRCIVISGDNPLTVSSIATKAGIDNANKYIDLSTIPDDKIPEIVDKYTIFGRVTPSQKQLLVKALKAKKKTVAMTGDGVNDILALREAHCSIAMASGSEAAKNVSQLVLLDSDFGSMPKVVSEGRKVINNIQKTSTLFITKNIFTFFIALLTIYFNFRLFKNPDLVYYYPMTPNQYVIIDFLVVGIPSFFLTFLPNNDKISGKFLFNVFKTALPGALVVLTNTAIIYALSFPGTNGLNDSLIDPSYISTIITIVTSITCILVLLRVCFPLNLFKLILCIAMIVGTCFCIFHPSLQAYFDFKELRFVHILLIIALSEAAYPLIWIFSLSFTSIVKKFIKKNINYTIEVRVKKINDDDEVIYND